MTHLSVVHLSPKAAAALPAALAALPLPALLAYSLELFLLLSHAQVCVLHVCVDNEAASRLHAAVHLCVNRGRGWLGCRPLRSSSGCSWRQQAT